MEPGVKPLKVKSELGIKAMGNRVKVLEHVDGHRGVDLELDRVHILVQLCVVYPGRGDVLVIASTINM